ncbi:MAG: gamma-glutamyl-gamma-aminobutyrate hydrolase family protein [Clostridia bacterium]|nr:gamma-glutamyl-gamma-aminobutyrate hydrolase family protein [Clostridia bacterium]
MLNGKKVVGIVPTSPRFGTQENRYDEAYKFSDTYAQRILEAGAVPVGVLPVGNRLRTDVLDLCDAILSQGGSKVNPYHIDAVDHAVRTGKKMLGICLGCQSIQAYFYTRSIARAEGWQGALSDLFAQLTERDAFRFLSRVEGHGTGNGLPRENLDAIKHKVILDEGSRAAAIFGAREVMGASIHHYAVADPAPGVRVTGRAEDGVVEVIECDPAIIGVQFHPDVDTALPGIFRWLAE